MEKQTQAPGQFFEVAPAFKQAAMSILSERPFAEVANPMAILRKDTNVYHIEEINVVVGYIGDMPYGVVSKFFDSVKEWVKEYTATEPSEGKILTPVSEAEVMPETEQA